MASGFPLQPENNPLEGDLVEPTDPWEIFSESSEEEVSLDVTKKLSVGNHSQGARSKLHSPQKKWNSPWSAI